MDPVAAVALAFARFFEFLATPVGQKVAEDWLKTAQGMRTDMERFFNDPQGYIAAKAPGK